MNHLIQEVLCPSSGGGQSTQDGFKVPAQIQQ